jgi:ADP-heptose:LPS heptosyltransferase
MFTPPEINMADRDFRLKHSNVLFHAGCSQRKMWERKRWSHYMELVDLLVKNNINIYCCGKKDEEICHPQVTSFCDLPIQETIALINQCGLFVSNDSGLMHIAAALRKKQVAVFTATNNKKSGPAYNINCHVITPPIDCFPCQDKEMWNQCSDWKCQDAISVPEVYGLIKRLLNSNQP